MDSEEEDREAVFQIGNRISRRIGAGSALTLPIEIAGAAARGRLAATVLAARHKLRANEGVQASVEADVAVSAVGEVVEAEAAVAEDAAEEEAVEGGARPRPDNIAMLMRRIVNIALVTI